MDLFGKSDGLPVPPTCMITVFATPGTDTQSSINYCIPIKGVVCNTKQIAIIRMLESSSNISTGIVIMSNNNLVWLVCELCLYIITIIIN